MIVRLANIILIEGGGKTNVMKHLTVDGLKVSWDESGVPQFKAEVLETGEVFTSDTDSFDFSDKGIIYPVFTVKITPIFPNTSSRKVTLVTPNVGIGYGAVGVDLMIGFVKPIRGVGFMQVGQTLIIN